MGWFDPIIAVPGVTFNRLQLLVREVHYMEVGDELDSTDLRDETERFISKLLDEYARQHFEASTKVAAQLIVDKRRLW